MCEQVSRNRLTNQQSYHISTTTTVTEQLIVIFEVYLLKCLQKCIANSYTSRHSVFAQRRYQTAQTDDGSQNQRI